MSIEISPNFQNESHMVAGENKGCKKITVTNVSFSFNYVILLSPTALLKVHGYVLKSNGHKPNSLVTMF